MTRSRIIWTAFIGWIISLRSGKLGSQKSISHIPFVPWKEGRFLSRYNNGSTAPWWMVIWKHKNIAEIVIIHCCFSLITSVRSRPHSIRYVFLITFSMVVLPSTQVIAKILTFWSLFSAMSSICNAFWRNGIESKGLCFQNEWSEAVLIVSAYPCIIWSHISIENEEFRCCCHFAHDRWFWLWFGMRSRTGKSI